MLNLSYEYKLKPSKFQIEQIEHTLDVCRSIWNFALLERIDWMRSRKSPVNACSIQQEYILSPETKYPNYNEQAKSLTLARKQNKKIADVNAQVEQQVLRTLERAFADREKKNLGFPRFKNLNRMRSFVFPQMLKNCIKGNQIKLPQLGWVKFRQSRPIPDGFLVKQARIVRKATGYFVILSLQSDVDIPQPIPHGHPKGLDIGFICAVVTSDNESIPRPRFLNKYLRELKRLQRMLKKKQKGSCGWKKLQKRIARLHFKTTSHRKDYHFKLSHHLVKDAGMIFVEDINFRMWQRSFLSKSSADFGFGQFIDILEWVCFRTDTYLCKVDHRYTSQGCPECGARTGKKDLKERVHQCPECGYITGRDHASALVIRNRGLDLVAVGQSVQEKASGDGRGGGEFTRLATNLRS
ncbi:transposase [Cyanobacterium aponinum UTEX 3221]|uniref:Transposase IS891/IS1136/IS1341 family n=1 Tax=Cyanobacterium aponinum (strain PCC 10605) TaxID=755178 RepID=K9Z7V7_CYAAP|nr:RNA-guided endonuclease TnpB family protein [Cyanobacterium aponinum]AFZ54665.1 transposase IS891/IS1136/IS1341 family [Cyanobacterium aponinum PCC 10605]WRL37011.1 transposase [Cyanobacterium aponinum UTEX 3221]